MSHRHRQPLMADLGTTIGTDDGMKWISVVAVDVAIVVTGVAAAVGGVVVVVDNEELLDHRACSSSIASYVDGSSMATCDVAKRQSTISGFAIYKVKATSVDERNERGDEGEGERD